MARTSLFIGGLNEPTLALPPDRWLSVPEHSAQLRDPTASPSTVNRFGDAVGKPLALVRFASQVSGILTDTTARAYAPPPLSVKISKMKRHYEPFILPLQGAKTALHYRIKPF